ncbi:MAG: EAL domain-containing protein [Cyanobacteria bacterium SBLK]|nr:EAL domain-containing protein [Cyanobacteria bacterium SBLK]
MSKILVIEDEKQIRANIKEILELNDFQTLSAENGRVGLDLAIEHHPDLILCDVMMPEMDGHEVVSQLRRHTETQDTPFIFLTAKIEHKDRREGMQLGADDYLTKPFAPQDLVDAIRTRLARQAQHDRRHQHQIDQAKAEINYLIHYDRITGLPNQLRLQQSFQKLRRQSARYNRELPLILMGIDRFNQVRETAGHLTGNALLEAMARRLTKYFSDFRTKSSEGLHSIAYLGMDRFAFLLQPTEEPFNTAQFAEGILDALSTPFLLNNREFFLFPSIGIAWSKAGRGDFRVVLAQAEGAMRQARKQGGNGYQFHNPTIHLRSKRRAVLETSLHDALDRDEFYLLYQPQIDIQNERIIGAEALIRWQHPKLGAISPAEFIPIAEETGAILTIGQWVLRHACQQVKEWQEMGLTPLKVSVNLSARQFCQPHLLNRVEESLLETGIPPECLELELTESAVVRNLSATARTLQQFADLGVRIAIDDFGKGYSSLEYLRKLPFHSLKIDQCFVRDILSNSEHLAIVAAILQMSEALNLQPIAEGVETREELEVLRQHHCYIIQGYLFSKPIKAKEFSQFYRSFSTCFH